MNTEYLSKQLINIQDFTKKPLTPKEVTVGLEQFSTRVSSLIEDRNKKGVEWKNLQQLLRVALKDVALEVSDAPEKDLQELERLKQKSKQQIDDLKYKLKDFQFLDLPKERTQLKKSLEETREAKSFQIELKHLFSAHTDKLKEKNSTSARHSGVTK
ncbi:hypothetical protein [Gillisia marina]|uniref:hypothetical protein n=1 Tax=Gillisia marina TaxID=1167637 RepID=UPI00029B19D6|nr:hypothetical protein [Gillisia marina]